MRQIRLQKIVADEREYWQKWALQDDSTYVRHWLIYNEPFDRTFDENKAGSIYRIYDCGKDKWFL